METAKQTRTILLVDDDIDFLSQQRVHLERDGYEVATAESADEAEGMLEDVKPDLAIIDLMMEEHDSGFALAWRLKRYNEAMPVILVTAVTRDTRVAFDDGGAGRNWIKADAILHKPVRFEQLQREIGRLLRGE